MEQRPFGNDKREVPVIGMGTWYIDNAERTAAIDALRRGIDRGERLNRAIEAISLRVPITAIIPPTQAAKAHQHLAAGYVLGKVVLRIR